MCVDVHVMADGAIQHPTGGSVGRCLPLHLVVVGELHERASAEELPAA